MDQHTFIEARFPLKGQKKRQNCVAFLLLREIWLHGTKDSVFSSSVFCTSQHSLSRLKLSIICKTLSALWVFDSSHVGSQIVQLLHLADQSLWSLIWSLSRSTNNGHADWPNSKMGWNADCQLCIASEPFPDQMMQHTKSILGNLLWFVCCTAFFLF